MTATPFGAQVVDDPVEPLDLVLGERRGRLVHDHDARVQRHRACDLHELDLRHREVAGLGIGVELDADLVEEPAGVASHPGVVHESEAAAREPAQPDVLHDRARRDRVELLLDHRDACAHRLRRRGEPHRLAARTISPASGWTRPARTFMSVDLPAPFSPHRAWTVPARTVMSTDSSAVTPGNVFVMPRMTSNGASTSVGVAAGAGAIGGSTGLVISSS